MTCGYYRTSSPVTALPIIMRWNSDVPSKIVKILEYVPAHPTYVISHPCHRVSGQGDIRSPRMGLSLAWRQA
jgi:hypothetical protein